MSTVFRAAACLFLLVAMVGCGSWVVSEAEGRRFSHPVGWQVRLAGEQLGLPHSRHLFRLSTMELGPECVELAPDQVDCGRALPPLAHGDVVITWSQSCCAGGRPDGGEPMTVDGREARLQIADAGDTLCDGADFGASVAIDIDELWTDHIELCTRGVEPVVALDAFRRFVLSIDLAPFN